jgi:Domain of unknown function(DUF2779)
MLTKSDIASFRQCHRRLWLQKNRPEAADPGDSMTWRRARDGTIVGEKARELLGPDLVWPRSQGPAEDAARAALAQLAAHPETPGVEIPLVRDELSARADALIPIAQRYVLQETKASTFPLKDDKVTPGKPDEHLLDDVAIQLWVLAASGLPLDHAELNLLNSRWRYPGEGDYRGLFRPWVIDESIQQRVAEVPQWLQAAQRILTEPMPQVVTGRQCQNPYSCPFYTHCSALDPPGPEHPIDLLPGMAGKNLARKLHQTKGYSSLLDPAPEELTGKDAPLYRRMQTAHRLGQPILEADSGAALAGLPWPRYYLDFEGIDLPVPRWAGVRPYEHVPFQWSCHIERAPGVFEHQEFLDLSGDDPSLACIDALLQTIPPGTGPVLVYHRTYEEGRLQQLGERHPQHRAALQHLIERLKDLLPLVRDSYYHPAMRGSFSIKKVLPTIAPDLDYSELSTVADGTAAQVAYLYAAFDPGTTPQQRDQYRQALLRYCKRDTWAMIEVAYHLQRLGRPDSASLALQPLL